MSTRSRCVLRLFTAAFWGAVAAAPDFQAGAFQHVYVEPYGEPEGHYVQGYWSDGGSVVAEAVSPKASRRDVLRVRRHGDGRLEVLPLGAECWDRNSGMDGEAQHYCCHVAPETQGCFDALFDRERCCDAVVGRIPDSFAEDLLGLLPPHWVDEGVYEARRVQFSGGGRAPAHPICYESSWAELDGLPREALLEGLYEVLRAAEGADSGGAVTGGGLLTGRVVSIGALDGKTGDPLFPSTEAFNLSGVFIEADAAHFEALRETYREHPARAALVHAEATPGNLRELLTAGVAAGLIPEAAAPGVPTVDLAAVDIDSWDCVLALELAKSTPPLLLHLELNPSVPPPFRFARLYSPRLTAWSSLRGFLGSTSCSLSFAVRRLEELGYALLVFDGYNGIFAHERTWEVFERRFPGLRLPQDEFECYRRARVWVTTLPPEFVRDWSFRTADIHEVLDLIWANLTRLAREEGFGDLPLSLELT